MPEINFVHDYRSLQPMADEAKIQARQASFAEIKADVDKNSERSADLTRLAFKLQYRDTTESDEWFSAFMREHSPTFSMTHDREEAAIVATLVLRQHILSGLSRSSILVLTAGFGGRRETVDKGHIITLAKGRLAQSVRRIGQQANIGRVSLQNIPDLAAAVATYNEQVGTEGMTKTFVDAQSTAYVQRLNNVVKEMNGIVGKLGEENARLMGEVNMLWWHIGGHSVLVDKPIDSLPPEIRPFVVGADVAKIVGAPPGPYGAYGVIRKALGPNPDEQIKLSDALKALKSSGLTSVVERLVENDEALIPIHYAVSAALLDGSLVSGPQFRKATGLSLDTKLSLYDIALQFFHERLLINDGLAN